MLITMALSQDQNKKLLELENTPVPEVNAAREALRNAATHLLTCDPTPEEKKRIGLVITKFSREKVRRAQPVVLAPIQDDPHLDNATQQFAFYLGMLFATSGCASPDTNAWNHARSNIMLLIHDQASGGPRYRDLFLEGVKRLQKLNYAGRRLHTRVSNGLLKLVQRLSGSSKEQNALGNYKGALAELLLAIEALSLEGIKVKVPDSNRNIDEDLDQSTLKMKSHDIDRIETIGLTKFYIEVKADVGTAIKAHGNYNPQIQVNQILNVIETRDRRDKKEYGHVRYNRCPAVAVLNSAEWLRLFTAGTAKLYADLGFYLFIGGQRFTPQELRTLYDYIYKTALGREKEFFAANVGTFSSPDVVARELRSGNLSRLLKTANLPNSKSTANRRDTSTGSNPSDYKAPIIISSNSQKRPVKPRAMAEQSDVRVNGNVIHEIDIEGLIAEARQLQNMGRQPVQIHQYLHDTLGIPHEVCERVLNAL